MGRAEAECGTTVTTGGEALVASSGRDSSRFTHERGGVIWFTGLPSAGKTTLSQILATELRSRGLKIELLDGDEVRKMLSKGLGFTKDDRDTHIRRIAYVAQLLAKNGVWVLVAVISPYRAVRDEVRTQVLSQSADFIEVYVRCPLEVAEARDTKGLYRRARLGEIPMFTGISDPYEEPLSPEVVVDTDRESLEECVKRILRS
jgi:adenylyl-sulfate kinase